MHIEGQGIRVDEFGGDGGAYFLTHLHSDHMAGLARGWNRGPLYCSTLTAKLLHERLNLDGGVVRVIEPGRPVAVDAGSGGFSVTAIEANHCPGALMFHFEWPGRRVLYTGDFRLSDDIRAHAAALAGVDVAYVDTTYDHPRYVFPSQEVSIARVLELVAQHMDKEVFLAVYSIGKTKVLQAVVKKFGVPVYVTDQVMRLYRAMGLDGLVTRDEDATNLRAYARGYYGKYFPWRHRRFRSTHAVIIPTGWAVDTHSPNGYFFVPYSEHCDYPELCEFREILRAKKTVPI
jgi:Cft2 family RNA processing exonuclease